MTANRTDRLARIEARALEIANRRQTAWDRATIRRNRYANGLSAGPLSVGTDPVHRALKAEVDRFAGRAVVAWNRWERISDAIHTALIETRHPTRSPDPCS
jgi:hypothetical protein